MTLNFALIHDLDLGFSRSNFEIVVSLELGGRLTWDERDVSQTHFVTLNLDLTRELGLRFSRSGLKSCIWRLGGEDVEWQDVELTMWSWAMILSLYFQGQVVKYPYPIMGGTIDMQRKGCESISCWTHCETLTFNLIHDLGDSHISWMGGSINLERKGLSAILLRFWAHNATFGLQYELASSCPWATAHTKYIGQYAKKKKVLKNILLTALLQSIHHPNQLSNHNARNHGLSETECMSGGLCERHDLLHRHKIHVHYSSC